MKPKNPVLSEAFPYSLSKDKILLVNLSKGLLGDYNSALIGHIVFSRLWSAALERASIPAHERREFFIYIDEFQNMTTDSLPAVLSEARKFRVGLTLANQFFSQVPELTREAIMGNVGSRITFRLGPKDAEPFAHWLGPDVDSHDLTGLPNHLAVGALSNHGVPIDPFALSVMVLVAALPSASNVSLLAERFGADTGRIARIILLTTAAAFLTFSGAVALLH